MEINCSASVKVNSNKLDHDKISDNSPDNMARNIGETSGGCDTEKMKQLLDRLYDSRKLEIEQLLHRSVFLGTFIVLSFTGYGAFVGKMLETNHKMLKCSLVSVFNQPPVMMVGMLFGIVISVLGFLWICMAKGSKRWEDVYEAKIIKLEQKIFVSGILKQYIYMAERDQTTGNDLAACGGFFSLKAAPYSPSRINVILGWIILALGITIEIMHGMIGCFLCDWWNNCIAQTILFVRICGGGAITFLTCYLLNNKLKHTVR